MQQVLGLKAVGIVSARFSNSPITRVSMSLVGGGAPPQTLREKPLAEGLAYTFYTYCDAGVPLEERWKPTGLRDIFFDDFEDVKRTVLAMRGDLATDPEMEWMPINIEKVVTVPISQSNILALLNDGPGAFVADYEVLETII